MYTTEIHLENSSKYGKVLNPDTDSHRTEFISDKIRHDDIVVWVAVRHLPVPVEPGLDVHAADHGGLQV
mgnify:CR=1 FL=1